MSNINNILPDDCLLEILDRVPLSNLILNIPLVCNRWSVLQPTICRRKQSLALFLGKARSQGGHEKIVLKSTNYLGISLRSIPFNLLVVKQQQIKNNNISSTFFNNNNNNNKNILEEESVYPLLAKLPNIIELELVQDWICTPTAIERLLEGWSKRNRFTSLKVMFGLFSNTKTKQTELEHLDQTIARLVRSSSLKCLVLSIHGPYISMFNSVMSSFEGDSALEQLYIGSNWITLNRPHRTLPNIDPLMARLSGKMMMKSNQKKSKITHFGLSDFPLTTNNFIQLVKWRSIDPAQLTHLTLCANRLFVGFNENFFELICRTLGGCNSQLRYLHLATRKVGSLWKCSEVVVPIARWFKRVKYLRIPFWHESDSVELAQLVEQDVKFDSVKTLHFADRYPRKNRTIYPDTLMEVKAIYPILTKVHFSSAWKCWCCIGEDEKQIALFNCRNRTECERKLCQVLCPAFPELQTIYADCPFDDQNFTDTFCDRTEHNLFY